MKNLGFGLMRLPLIEGGENLDIDLERVKAMADEFLANGFTYFDTAPPYHGGMSEIAFREAVAKRYPRDAYTITDKLSLFMIKDAGKIPGFFEKQLEDLGVDYMDYYLLHGLSKNFYRQAEEMNAFEFVVKKKEEGKVKHIGFSFHDKPEVLDEILKNHPEMEYVQLQLNYLDWDDEEVMAQQCYEVANKYGKPVIVMEPVKGGALADVPEKVKDLFQEVNPNLSTASWAIRFAATHENVMMVLSGMSNEEQMRDNISYMTNFKPLNHKEMETIWKAVDMMKSDIIIHCTACRYCISVCPKKIAIPEYFAAYNDLKKSGKMTDAWTDYSNLNKNHGKASDCVKCGNCEKRCPQHLPIREYLQEVARTFE